MGIGEIAVAVGQTVLRAAGREQALKNWREKDKFQQRYSAAIGAPGNSRPCGRALFSYRLLAFSPTARPARPKILQFRRSPQAASWEYLNGKAQRFPHSF